ncbi:hypothetical protein [Mycobacterium leprae]|uniref:hypothetical protein n=1 Tax=Mycobacterium leprae TaxID=1769 RepID=UPI00030FC6B9|nr:hypothetical protein [Mycobacterium leprae]
MPTAPTAEAAISDVMAWTKAGHLADPGYYHNATCDGVIAPLDSGSIVTSP